MKIANPPLPQFYHTQHSKSLLSAPRNSCLILRNQIVEGPLSVSKNNLCMVNIKIFRSSLTMFSVAPLRVKQPLTHHHPTAFLCRTHYSISFSQYFTFLLSTPGKQKTFLSFDKCFRESSSIFEETEHWKGGKILRNKEKIQGTTTYLHVLRNAILILIKTSQIRIDNIATHIKIKIKISLNRSNVSLHSKSMVAAAFLLDMTREVKTSYTHQWLFQGYNCMGLHEIGLRWTLGPKRLRSIMLFSFSFFI